MGRKRKDESVEATTPSEQENRLEANLAVAAVEAVFDQSETKPAEPELHPFSWALDRIASGGAAVRKCWFHNRNYLKLGARGKKTMIMQFSMVHKELCEWVPNQEDILAKDWIEA